MKKYIQTLISLFLLLPCLSWAAPQQAADDELYSLLSSFQSMTAQFHQTIYDAKNHPIRQSTGTMALSRPGKFRWEVQQPNQQQLIADGNTLWIYDVDLSQATRQKFNASKTSSPASLLSGSLDNLTDRFSIARINNAKDPSFRLVPQDHSGLFRWVNLYFKGGKLTNLQMLDSMGSLSVFQFTNVKMNPSLSVRMFQFTPPQGVDVIKQ